MAPTRTQMAAVVAGYILTAVGLWVTLDGPLTVAILVDHVTAVFLLAAACLGVLGSRDVFVDGA